MSLQNFTFYEFPGESQESQDMGDGAMAWWVEMFAFPALGYEFKFLKKERNWYECICIYNLSIVNWKQMDP